MRLWRRSARGQLEPALYIIDMLRAGDTYSELIGVHEAVLGGAAGGFVDAGVVGEGLDTGGLEKACDDYSCLVSIVSDRH